MKTLPLSIDSSVLNSNFRVKVHGLGYHTLVGWTGLKNLVGLHLAITSVRHALETGHYKTTIKFRRGLKIDFYAK